MLQSSFARLNLFYWEVFSCINAMSVQSTSNSILKKEGIYSDGLALLTLLYTLAAMSAAAADVDADGVKPVDDQLLAIPPLPNIEAALEAALEAEANDAVVVAPAWKAEGCDTISLYLTLR